MAQIQPDRIPIGKFGLSGAGPNRICTDSVFGALLRLTTTEKTMPNAYIASLNREMLEEADQPQSVRRDLRQRVLDWFGTLPAISRHRPFAMVELEKALGTQGKYLSPILLSLGWTRQRKWSSQGQYHRYWLPPSVHRTSYEAA